jgi:hypothetical protein
LTSKKSCKKLTGFSPAVSVAESFIWKTARRAKWRVWRHPNWAGVLGAYGEIVEQPFGLNLVTTAKPDGYAAGLFVLLSTLKSFEGYYKQAGDSVRKLNDCFERIDPPKK